MMRILVGVMIVLTLPSCSKNCDWGVVGYLANGECEGGCGLAGTTWRMEVTFTGIPQAWTLQFTEKNFDSYWGVSGNYYQNHDVKSGTWDCSGNTVTIEGFSSSTGRSMKTTGTIDGDRMTFSGTGGGVYIKQ